MDAAMLVVGILGLLAAAAAARFAYPSFKASRARPDLLLFVQPSGGSGGGPGPRHATMYARLYNCGEGVAADWRVQISSGERKVRVHRGPRPGVWEHPSGVGWLVEWQATGADDSIPPGLERELILITDDFQADETVQASFQISARRMKERPSSGDVWLTWPEGASSASIDVT